MSSFQGSNKERLGREAIASQKKKTEIFFKGSALIKRTVRPSKGGAVVTTQINFASCGVEGIYPDTVCVITP